MSESQTTGKIAKQQDPTSSHAELVRYLGDHRSWWWRLLRLGSFLNFFIPWPLHKPLAYVAGLLSGKKLDWKENSNGLLTVAILLSAGLLYIMRSHANALEVYATIAADASKALLSGAFLLGTILSVSVALPGHTVLRFVVKNKPIAIVRFVVPFAWAFMWGLSGSALLLFYGSRLWRPWYQYVAVSVGVYGAMMELNALIHVLRIYTIGLALWGRDEKKKEEQEKAGQSN